MKCSSILNDVLGPIMTGPSSSHTAAPGRIGLAVGQLWGKKVHRARVIYDSAGSYPNTHIGQGSDFGFAGGLLGYHIDDPRFGDSISLAKQTDTNISFEIGILGFHHPNEAQIDVYDDENPTVSMSVLSHSTGGGTFLLMEMDGFEIEFDGGRKKYYIACGSEACEKSISKDLKQAGAQFVIRQSRNTRTTYVSVPSHEAILFEVEAASLENDMLPPGILENSHVLYFRTADAIVPAPLRLNPHVPFESSHGALQYAAEHKIDSIARLAVEYECSLSFLNRDDAYEKMRHVLRVMRLSMQPPPENSPSHNLLMPQYANHFKNINKLPIDMGAANGCMTSAVAVMENSCAHQVIVAAPTAGSSGVIPAAIVAVGETLGCSDNQILDALWASGLVGGFISNQATFGAELAGCQAEIGSAACMAAAGLVELLNGTIDQSFHAACIAMQSFLGLICDPVGGLTEFPCIERNVTAATVSIMAANMALCGMKSLIPLDETIQAMLAVGESLPSELRCTCKGGLCGTPTGIKLSKLVSDKQKQNN